MRGEMSLINKFSQGCLYDDLARALQFVQTAFEAFRQVGWHNQIAKFDAGVHNLGEGAQIQHPAILIHALQGRERVTIKAKLAVIIIFQDP